MNNHYAMLACLLALLIPSAAFAQNDSQTRVEEILQELESHPVRANETQTAEAIARLKELGELGPEATSAVPFLLSEEFFLIKGGYTATDRPLRLATIDTLVRIGEPAVPAVIELLSMPTGRNKFEWSNWGKVILRHMARTETVDAIIPALAEEMQTAPHKYEFYQLLALMGPKSVPVLQREARELAAKENLRKADANDLRRLGDLIGEEIGPAIDAVIPDRFTEETWNDDRYWIHYGGGFWPLAHARPDPKNIPAFLDLIKNDKLSRQYYFRSFRLVGMLLSGMGDAAALPLADLLDDPNPQTRWAAATLLAMIGPDMKAALPALEKAQADQDEDIRVRVAAARAIAEIRSVNPHELYQNLPDVENQIVALSRENRMMSQRRELWQEHFEADPEKTMARQLALYNLTLEFEKPLYLLATGKDVKAQNQLLREHAAETLANLPEVLPSLTGTVLDTDAHVFLLLFGSKSRLYPGRLEADVEKSLKEICFTALDITKVDSKPRYLPKTTEHLRKLLALDESLSILEMSNGPMRSDANQYLILQVLKDDPVYANRKFVTGDSVQQRYDAYTDFMRRGLKSLALHGMWAELGSSNYEHKTYRGLLALIDYATDPVVAARARMFMDLAMIEIEQISLSGLRGGSKTRAKDGGLLGRFNRTTTMLYGEHHGFILEPPGFKNAYQAPVPAVLLRRLGRTQPVYEIVNRHVSEHATLEENYIPQYKRVFKFPGRSINYAYCTPEYVTGCAMFDVRLWHGEAKERNLIYGTMGRWSGVIFRNRGGVYLEAYTGEKYNVQDKDVMIAQVFKGARYTGEPRVDFASIMEMVERDGWVFVHNHGGYAAVRVVRGGHYWNEPARHRLYLNDAFSPVIIQTGRQALYESFKKFQRAVLSAPLTLTEDKLDYTGPNSSRIEFFLCKDSDEDPYPESLPRIDGKELELNLNHNYRSPYMNNPVGSNVVTVSYGNRNWEYDFEKNTVTERR